MQLEHLENQQGSAARRLSRQASLPTDAPAAEAAPAGRRVDQVSLSDPALSYAAAYRAVAAAAWVRPERVAALKAAIENDSYDVSSRALASAMSGKA